MSTQYPLLKTKYKMLLLCSLFFYAYRVGNNGMHGINLDFFNSSENSENLGYEYFRVRSTLKSPINVTLFSPYF